MRIKLTRPFFDKPAGSVLEIKDIRVNLSGGITGILRVDGVEFLPDAPPQPEPVYRLLEVGEVVRSTDECCCDGGWQPPAFWGFPLTRHTLPYRRLVEPEPPAKTYETENDPDILRQQRDNWEQTAAQIQRGTAYYQGLLDQIGQTLGVAAFICDDGSISDEPLRAKLPELVDTLTRRIFNEPIAHKLMAACALALEKSAVAIGEMQAKFSSPNSPGPMVGYRLLEPGDVIQLGDEVASGGFTNPWLSSVPVSAEWGNSALVGTVLSNCWNHQNMFRRKTS